MTILITECCKLLFFFFSFQLSGEVILQIASEPVLPFNALDIALGVQNSLKGNFSLNCFNFSKWESFQILTRRTRWSIQSLKSCSNDVALSLEGRRGTIENCLRHPADRTETDFVWQKAVCPRLKEADGCLSLKRFGSQSFPY